MGKSDRCLDYRPNAVRSEHTTDVEVLPVEGSSGYEMFIKWQTRNI